ncbi:hypothetical protein Hanom_Chr07g00642281 [Helianthus anomalus]
MSCKNVRLAHLVEALAGGKYVNVQDVKGFTKAGSSNHSTRRSIEAEGKSKKGKEFPLVVGKKSKAENKKVVVPSAKRSPGKSKEGSTDVNPGDVYVLDWSIKVGDSFRSSAVCEDVLTHFGPPMVRGSLSAMDDDSMIAMMMMSACNFASMLPEGGV